MKYKPNDSSECRYQVYFLELSFEPLDCSKCSVHLQIMNNCCLHELYPNFNQWWYRFYVTMNTIKIRANFESITQLEKMFRWREDLEERDMFSAPFSLLTTFVFAEKDDCIYIRSGTHGCTYLPLTSVWRTIGTIFIFQTGLHFPQNVLTTLFLSMFESMFS